MEATPMSALLPEGCDPAQFKVHFAVWNQQKHPIDVLATNWEEWQELLRRRPGRYAPCWATSAE